MRLKQKGHTFAGKVNAGVRGALEALISQQAIGAAVIAAIAAV